ncbi:MAG: helix-turn-helix domain-containing protein [Planctomycetes bacterium]|nr:helix-turn-helix domain-containing protein [Planctomycetota bacterium]
MSKTCRYFGISRNAFYKWQRRYVELGEVGLINCSRRPLHSPRASSMHL